MYKGDIYLQQLQSHDVLRQRDIRSHLSLSLTQLTDRSFCPHKITAAEQWRMAREMTAEQ